MTAKKDLKRRVRARQARTGESYTAARAHVVADAPVEVAPPPRPPVFPVEEIVEPAEAAELGFRCAVGVSSRLLAKVDARALLVRVRDALIATDGDPATRVLCALALRGIAPAPDRPHGRAAWARYWDETRRFGARMRAGIGGVSERGDLLALHVDGRDGAGAVFVLCLTGVARMMVAPSAAAKPPRLLLTLADTKTLEPGVPLGYPR